MFDSLPESVMQKLLNWFANRRRPDTVEADQFYWSLLSLFGFNVGICLVFRSEEHDDFRPNPDELHWVVLSGGYLARILRVDGRNIRLEDTWAFAYRHYPRNAMFNIELPAARDFAEAMLRFRWMSVPEMVFDAKKPLWLLVVSRG